MDEDPHRCRDAMQRRGVPALNAMHPDETRHRRPLPPATARDSSARQRASALQPTQMVCTTPQKVAPVCTTPQKVASALQPKNGLHHPSKGCTGWHHPSKGCIGPPAKNMVRATPQKVAPTSKPKKPNTKRSHLPPGKKRPRQHPSRGSSRY